MGNLSDRITGVLGSWGFLCVQTLALVGYCIYNSLYSGHPFDPYPYILLNLILSFQAAYSNTIILMSQSRMMQADRDNIHKLLKSVRRLEKELTAKIEELDEE